MVSPRSRWPAAASPWRDVGLALLGAGLVGILASAFNLSERFAAFTRGWEGLQLDELPLVLLVLSAGLLGVAERRSARRLRPSAR